MSGRPDHAAARWADDADGGVESAGVGGVDGDEVSGAGVEGAGAGGDGGAVEDVDVAGEAGEADEAGEAVEAVDGPIMADVSALAAQRDEYLESLQRLKADFDNYRKRVARLQEEQSVRAEASLVGKLLPVLDNLDLAWAHLGPRDVNGEDDDAGVSEEARAIAQARGQLLDVLGKEGLERVDAVGVAFDPTVHDAVAHTDVSGEGTDTGVGRGTISGNWSGSTPATVSVDEVLRAGYRWRGQVLRPAMVRVRG